MRANITLGRLREFARGPGIISDVEEEEAAARLVDRLRIRCATVEQPVCELSGGNQQKVVIAKWLLADCDVLIFDEPTRGIDVGAKAEIYEIMNELAAQGDTIVMISSELPEIMAMSDRVLVMQGGRIRGELSREQATQERIMHFATASDDGETTAEEAAS